MLKAVVTFYDNAEPLAVAIGYGEDVKAPRDLSTLEKQGWIVDENVELAYKCLLAAKRQGDVPADTKFESWVDRIAEIDARPSEKQLRQAVALGGMTQEQADLLRASYGDDAEGEAETPLV